MECSGRIRKKEIAVRLGLILLSQILILIPLLLFVACQPRAKRPFHKEDVKLRPLSITIGGATDKADVCYHYVVVDNYDEQHQQEIDFLALAYHYRDSVKACSRIECIKFFSTDKDFHMGDLSQEWEEIEKNRIMDIWFDEATIDTKHPRVQLITLYKQHWYGTIEVNGGLSLLHLNEPESNLINDIEVQKGLK